MFRLLHSVKLGSGESIPAGTEVAYIGPAPRAGRWPHYREQVQVELPDGRRVAIDASAIDAHSFTKRAVVQTPTGFVEVETVGGDPDQIAQDVARTVEAIRDGDDWKVER
jgi:hypothetical protein